MYSDLHNELLKLGDTNHAILLSRFFQTGKGQYGEGDKFIGLRVPQVRKIARLYANATLPDLDAILQSPWHEERLLALVVLTKQFERAKKDEEKQRLIAAFYLEHTNRINNWDLVDVSAAKIIGPWFAANPKERKTLVRLARSKNVWERRMSAIASFSLIRAGDTDEAIKIFEILLKDKHDLIHKAVGWMVREMGKRDKKRTLAFLEKHATTMPRTALRYALEKFDEPTRKHFMSR